MRVYLRYESQCVSNLKGGNKYLGSEPGAMNATLFVFALDLLGLALFYVVNLHTKARALTFNLFKSTLLRLLIWSPTEEFCAVTKATAGVMIKLNFNHELCF